MKSITSERNFRQIVYLENRLTRVERRVKALEESYNGATEAYQTLAQQISDSTDVAKDLFEAVKNLNIRFNQQNKGGIDHG